MMQGDAYSVPVVIKAKDGTVITPEMATRVEITIGSLSRQWPGVITFNEDTLAWEFPLTQQQSFRLSQGKQKTQVRVVFSNGWVVGGIGTDIRVLKSESRSVLPTSGQQAKSANMAFGAVYAEIGAMTVILGAGLPDISDATKGQYLTNDGDKAYWAEVQGGGGGEVNQNAWSNISIKEQSNATTAVEGQTAEATLAATSKTDTFAVASGNKWVDINGDGKQINIGHSLSGVTTGTYGNASRVPKVTVDAAGHVTSIETSLITPEAIGAATADAASTAQSAAEDAQEAADSKVASVTATANGGITVGGTATAPTVGIKLDPAEGNAATLGANGLMVTVPEVDVPEYTIAKLTTATEGYLATYQLQKDGVAAGVNIDIPKDYLVKSASIKTSTGTGDPSGFPAGTKYIDFVINTHDAASGTGTESHIYLNVQDLVDAYTPGNGIEISDANEVSAKVVAANGLSVDATGIKMSLASTTAAGAMSSADKGKLALIDEGATANNITLNGAETAAPSFYAPIGGGTAGQYLTAGGDGVAPTWTTLPTILKKYSATNSTLTASGGAFTWSITAATHGISNPMTVQLFEDATGVMVMADVTVTATGVTITINDTTSAGTLDAGTYRVVIVG